MDAVYETTSKVKRKKQTNMQQYSRGFKGKLKVYPYTGSQLFKKKITVMWCQILHRMSTAPSRGNFRQQPVPG